MCCLSGSSRRASRGELVASLAHRRSGSRGVIRLWPRAVETPAFSNTVLKRKEQAGSHGQLVCD